MGKQLKQLFRSHRGRLLFITLPVTIAIALFVLIRMIIGNVERQIVQETKQFLGADITINSQEPLSEELIDSIGFETTKQVHFSTNLISDDGKAELVRVEGVEENYPFYGQLEITDVAGIANEEGVFVDGETFDTFGSQGVITLGEKEFVIEGIIEEKPGATINMFDNGRTIIIPYDLVDLTGLTERGSRVRYYTLIKTDTEEQIGPLMDSLQNNPLFSQYEIEDYSSRAGQINEILGDFDQYVIVIIIMNFLLVVVIVMTSVRTFLALERKSIGLFKVLGQSTKSLVAVYTTLFLCCFIVSRLVGIALGSLGIIWLQTLPETAGFVLLPDVWIQAGIVTIIIACLGIILPYTELFGKPALELLRTEQSVLRSWKNTAMQGMVLFVGIRLFFGVIIEKWFVGVIFGLFLIIGCFLLGSLLLFCLRKVKNWSIFGFMFYDGIRSSSAPGNQSRTIGVGLTIIATVVIILSILSQAFLTTLQGFTDEQPSLFVTNIRQQDRPIIEKQYPGAVLFDTILARISTINGVVLSTYLEQQGIENTGSYTREFNNTTTQQAESPIISGKRGGPGAVTVDEEFAGRLGLALDDRIEFSVQGRIIPLEVIGLRKAYRSGASPFFYFQFDSEQFADAPKTYFWSVIIDKEEKALLQRTLIEQLGKHLSFIDVDDIIETVAGIARKISAVVQLLLLVMFLLVFCSAYVAVESLGLLRKKKTILYTKLGATRSMIHRSLYSELMSIVGISLCIGVVVSLVLLLWLFSVSNLLGFERVMIGKISGIVLGVVLCYGTLGGVIVKKSR